MSNQLEVGCTVEIFGLVSASQHNGSQGILVTFDSAKGRWGVKLSPSGEVLGVKPDNLKFVKGPEKVEDDEDDDDHRIVRAKRRFDQIRVKYGLDSDKVSGEIADLLTGKLGGTQVTAEEFAKRYGMKEEEAREFLMFIMMATDFKEKALDPHNATAAQLRKDLP